MIYKLRIDDIPQGAERENGGSKPPPYERLACYFLLILYISLLSYFALITEDSRLMQHFMLKTVEGCAIIFYMEYSKFVVNIKKG